LILEGKNGGMTCIGEQSNGLTSLIIIKS